MYTRKQYLNEECTHAEYYSQFVTSATMSRIKSRIGLVRILRSKEKNFSDIPLTEWDVCGICSTEAGALRQVGDYPTVAGVVCIAKEAARQIKQNAGIA